MATTTKKSVKVVKKATPAVKAVKTVKTVKAVTEKPAKAVEAHVAEKQTGLEMSVVGTDGKNSGKITLSSTYFDARINKQLLAQAVRVYLANQRVGHASTKTRGQVEGSTRKIYKQKHTGRARHGGIRAPIFVGGGVAFGPVPQDHSLSMPQKMKKHALASALTAKRKSGHIIIVSGLNDLEAKTKHYAQAFGQIGITGRTLLVTGKDAAVVIRNARNIKQVDVVPVTDMNTYGVVTHRTILFMKEAVQQLKD